MNENLTTLRKIISDLANNPDFVHHKWFVKWHLEIVDALARDMLELYPNANADTVIAMCWMHDYGKIVDFDSQYDHEYIEKGRQLMIDLGFDEAFATEVADNIKILDAKDNLASAVIEVQIVSSADGCSHLVGPFSSLYWQENPTIPFEDIMRENTRKQSVDWDKKVVIPEARKAYQPIHDVAMLKSTGAITKIT